MRRAKLLAGLTCAIVMCFVGSASANILSDLPVGTWPLNEGSGAVAHDLSGRGNDGALQGSGVQWTAGRFGKALSFNGTDGGVQVPDKPVYEPATGLTVSAWINSSVDPGDFSYIVSKSGNGCLTASYGLYSGPNGGLMFYVSNDGIVGTRSPDYGAGIYDGKWHNVIGTYDGTTIRLYVDGIQVGTGTPDSAPIQYGLSSSNNLVIGNYNGCSGLGFKGSIDQVRVFDRALDPNEIKLTVKTSQLLPSIIPQDLVL
jgi:hypothetical protein